MILALALMIWQASSSAPPKHEACPGALYFHSGKPAASWIKGKREVCRIGNLTFYTDKRKSK